LHIICAYFKVNFRPLGLGEERGIGTSVAWGEANCLEESSWVLGCERIGQQITRSSGNGTKETAQTTAGFRSTFSSLARVETTRHVVNNDAALYNSIAFIMLQVIKL
jgi:hypothetical protein